MDPTNSSQEKHSKTAAMSSKLPSCNVGPDEESEITDDDESDISKDGNRLSCEVTTIFCSILAYTLHISQDHTGCLIVKSAK